MAVLGYSVAQSLCLPTIALAQASFRFSGIPVSAFFRIPEPGGRTSEIGNRKRVGLCPKKGIPGLELTPVAFFLQAYYDVFDF